MSVMQLNDFKVDTISPNTKFILDTNILYYVHSGYYFGQWLNKSNSYSNIIQQIRNNGHIIYVSILSIQELFFVIEKKEYELYRTQCNQKISKKEYRKISSQRDRLKDKLTTIFEELSCSYSIIKSENVCCFSMQNFLKTYQLHRFDPMDYILVENNNDCKTIFISDDSDFKEFKNINLLTY